MNKYAGREREMGREGGIRPGKGGGRTDGWVRTGRQGWRDRWPGRDREKGMGEHWRERGTDGQEKASPAERGQRDSGARGQGWVRDPSGDGRGGQGERSVGDVDGRGTPVGWDRGQRDREKCSKRCPGMGRRAVGCP